MKTLDVSVDGIFVQIHHYVSMYRASLLCSFVRQSTDRG